MFKVLLSILITGSSLIGAIEVLDLDIIPYEKLMEGDMLSLEILDKALHEKGIVGIRNVPGYKEKYAQFIKSAREFSALPEEIKEAYKPNRELGETFLGYEAGEERFQRPNGDWIGDNLKTSYYAYIPDTAKNKWPLEVDLNIPFEELGELMSEVGEVIMYKVGLLGDSKGIYLEKNEARVGRMLYYKKSDQDGNPYWCETHFDHALFTAILPAVYFVNGEQISEPAEAGLFVRTFKELPFKKVVADDLDVMMFQVGEFGQLVSDDTIRATEHYVHKAIGPIERYTLAVFYRAPMDMPIYSTSVLTNDPRYGENPEEPTTYRYWHEASLQRSAVKETE